MHDFIEKPSRLILFAVSIIALVTIIILLSRSRLINLGGESLISGHGKLTASVTPTPAAVNTQEGNTNDTVTEEYEEVYIEDDEPVYEQDTWTEVEIDDQPAAEPVQEEVPAEENGDAGAEENMEEGDTEEAPAEEGAEQWDEVDIEEAA